MPTSRPLTDRRLERRLRRMLERVVASGGLAGVSTFADRRLLTRDRGLVLDLADGRSFHVSIKPARGR